MNEYLLNLKLEINYICGRWTNERRKKGGGRGRGGERGVREGGKEGRKTRQDKSHNRVAYYLNILLQPKRRKSSYLPSISSQIEEGSPALSSWNLLPKLFAIIRINSFWQIPLADLKRHYFKLNHLLPSIKPSRNLLLILALIPLNLDLANPKFTRFLGNN